VCGYYKTNIFHTNRVANLPTIQNFSGIPEIAGPLSRKRRKIFLDITVCVTKKEEGTENLKILKPMLQKCYWPEIL